MGVIGRLYAIIGADTTEWDKKMKGFEKSLNRVGKSLTMKLTLPIIAMGTAIVKSGADFEQAMKNAASVIQPTTEEFKAMTEVAKQLGQTTVFSAKQAAEAMYFMASAGWKADKIMQAMPDTLQLAAATQSDLAFTTETVISAMNQYNIKGEDVGRVTNSYAKAIAISQATLDRLSTSMAYIGPIAAGFGLTIEETIAPLGMLYDAGFDASMAGTSLRQALAELSDASPKTQKALEGIGLSITDVNPTMNNFADIVEKLGKAGATTSDIIKIFGVRSGPAMAQLVLKGAEAVRTATAAITGTKAASEMANIQINTFMGTWKLLKGAFVAVEQAIAEKLNPILKELIDNHLRPLLLHWAKMSEGTKSFILIVGGILAAIGPVLLSLGFLAKGLRIARDGLLLIVKVAGPFVRATKFMGEALTLLVGKLGGLGPALLKVGLVGIAFAFGAAIGTLLNKIKFLREGIQSAIGALLKLMGMEKDRTGGTGEGKKAVLSKASELSGKDITDYSEAVALLREEFKRTGDLGSEMLNKWAAGLKGIAPATVEAKSGVSDLAKGLRDMALAAQGMALEDMEAALGSLNDALTNNTELTANERYAIDQSRVALERKIAATKAAIAGDQAYGEFLKEFGGQTVEEVNARLESLSSFIRRLSADFKAGRISPENYRKVLKAVNEEVKTLKGTTGDFAKMLEDTGTVSFKQHAEAIDAIYIKMGQLDALLLGGVISQDDYTAAIKRQTEALREQNDFLTTKFLPVQSDERKRLIEEALKPENMPKFKGADASGWMTGPEPPKGISDTWKEIGDEISSTWSNVLSEMVEGTSSFADQINGIWTAIAAGVSKGLGSMATKALSKLGTNLLKSGSKLLGGALNVLAPGIGAAVGAIGGAIFKGIGKLFGIKSKAQKEAEKKAKEEKAAKAAIDATVKSLAAYGKVSEDTAKAINESRKSMSAAAATAMHFSEVVKDVGVNQKNVNALWQKATQILGEIKRAGANAAAMTTELGEAFSQLLEGTKKLGLEGSKAMIDFILEVRKSGVVVAEVVDYVKSQIDRLPSAITSLVAGYDKMGGAIQDLAAITLASFNAMVASGYTYAEALAALSDPLGKLREEYEKLGLSADGALAGLFKVSDVAAANKELFDSISANQEVIEALGNSGWMTADIMARLAENSKAYYQSLLEQGVGSEDALRVLAPQLEKLYQFSKAYGITLDEGVMSLINEAKAKGLVKEAPEDLASIQKEQRDILRDIRDIMRDKWGLKEWNDTMGRSDVYGYGPGSGYADEGIAWRPQLATLAERGPEAILGMDTFKKLVSRGGDVNVTTKPSFDVKVIIGDEEIENFVVRTTQKNLNARRLRVPAESIA